MAVEPEKSFRVYIDLLFFSWVPSALSVGGILSPLQDRLRAFIKAWLIISRLGISRIMYKKSADRRAHIQSWMIPFFYGKSLFVRKPGWPLIPLPYLFQRS
jgi:hypothetical protein